MTCAVEGCPRKVLARGWCANHYRRWWLYGSTDERPRATATDRFAALCAWDGEHLLWLGSAPGGYGRFWLNGGATMAHHFLLPEPVPDGLQADHQCRVTLCVLPEHIAVMTPGANTRRQLRHVNRTTCVHGHPYAGNRGASRRCKRCHANRMAGRPLAS